VPETVEIVFDKPDTYLLAFQAAQKAYDK